MTLGENIGDNGGLNIALRAYHNAQKEGHVISSDQKDFTADQLFFLGYARIWASNNREQYMDMLLTQDVHSPNMARVCCYPALLFGRQRPQCDVARR